MAKNRYIDTRFWHDTFVRDHLNPLDRYLFLYFLTNDKTNISGVYELPISMIANETGLDNEMLLKMIQRLVGKIHYIDGWIYIVNFQRYQNYKSPKIQIGIETEMSKIPLKIKDEIVKLNKSGIGYLYGIDTISHLNSNSNSNKNTKLSPSQINQDFFQRGEEYKKLKLEFTNKYGDEMTSREFNNFLLHWTEPNKGGTKVAWELKTTFDVKRRLITWFSRSIAWNKK